MTFPIRLERGTVPHLRESQDAARLSPIMKYRPYGILIGAIVPVSRRAARMYGSSSLRPLMKT
jgi:hypothetical protein